MFSGNIWNTANDKNCSYLCDKTGKTKRNDFTADPYIGTQELYFQFKCLKPKNAKHKVYRIQELSDNRSPSCPLNTPMEYKNK